nr:hypothetical protein [Gammaproteobacteria bacterium]
MAKWLITFSKDNATDTLEIHSDHKPSMEEAVVHVRQWADQHLEQGDFGDREDRLSDEPAVELLHLYGITITGIAKI